MTTVPSHDAAAPLAGLRVAVVGRLAGMPKREAHQVIRAHGGTPAERVDASVDLVVLGEEDSPLGAALGDEWLDDGGRQAAQGGTLEVITETQLWERLGLVDASQHVHRLYTPAMLAELLGVSVAVIRRWHRRGLIKPAREVRRLAYFDFQEIATARRLIELLAAGMSPQAIEKKLAALARLAPHIDRPLAQLSVIVQGKHLLLRQGDLLVAPEGQQWFDFAASEAQPADAPAATAIVQTTAAGPREAQPAALPSSPDELARLACELDDAGQLEAAAEMYRAALAAGGPNAELCFLLAETLYRLGEVAAARERYFMAIEIDEDYVEARANLGCVLAELGQRELALAAFHGALAYHPQYADVHYHLARLLEDCGRGAEAVGHWREF
jgi:tetratricopeptide (TPR) repeat protein